MLSREKQAVLVTIKSPWGWLAAAGTPAKLRSLTFGHDSAAAAVAALPLDDRDAAVAKPQATAWGVPLVDYTQGNLQALSRIDVELPPMTPFQERVVKACRKIPPGKTRTYLELAAAAGSPRAARAVGSVMRKNRLPLVIPCHRVVGAAGRLGGYSAPGGPEVKRRLLAAEGVTCK